MRIYRSSSRHSRRASSRRRAERLVEIRENVVDVLDADAQADASRTDARGELLLGVHLTVGGGGRVTGERFRVAEVHQALEEPERVVEAHARRQATVHVE